MKYLHEIFVLFTGLIALAIARDPMDLNSPDYIPAVEFVKEEITLEVGEGHACVTGIYSFRNNTDRDLQMPVVFPFYVDSLTAFPHHIEAAVITVDGENNLDYKRVPERNLISMHIPMKASGTTNWRLTYQQEIGANRAVYIITTTAAWKKPLKEATYYFIAPDLFSNIKTWPLPDTIYTDGAKKIFKSVRYDFMPQRDMEITWE